MGACDTWNVEINILVYENEKLIEDIIIESNEFEIDVKSKLAPLKKLVRK